MRKSQLRKSQERGAGSGAHTGEQRSQQKLDLAAVEPDLLRVSVREALSRLSEEDRRAMYVRLLTALKGAGVNIGQHLVLLGIPARTTEELTAAEIATLIRYVRINEPKALAVLTPMLSEPVSAYLEHEGRLKSSRRAA